MNIYSYESVTFVVIMKKEKYQMMDMEDVAYVLKAISNPTRLKVIDVLRSVDEMNVSDMVNIIGCEQSLLSHHITDMRAKGILNCRKEGKRCFYSLKNRQITQILDCIQSCIDSENN